VSQLRNGQQEIMKDATIGFIGGGNMARSLIGGLIADGKAADGIWVSDPDEGQRAQLQERFGIQVTASNEALVEACDVVVLAVKPQVLGGVCRSIADAVQRTNPLILSVAAGVRIEALERWLGGKAAIVRSMPNTPALVGSGATALVANAHTAESQRELAEAVLRAVGLALWLADEEQMDAVTALSGSGPAYFFLVMEALEQAGRKLGLPADTARLLTLETAFGAAKMALESDDDAAALRQRVTSPGGTTERAIGVLESRDLREAFAEALEAARDRSRELAQILGEQEQ
jgi:pyrroline-5-carboxylate reductase